MSRPTPKYGESWQWSATGDELWGISDADARLINAAPDLYEALRRGLRKIELGESEFGDDDHIADLARAALEKAGWKDEFEEGSA